MRFNHSSRVGSSDTSLKADRLLAKVKRNLRAGKAPTCRLSDRDIHVLLTRYSHFEDCCDRQGYLTSSMHVVTALSTPRPYLHLMSSNRTGRNGIFGSFWDQTGLGFSCYDSVLAGAVTSHKDSSYVPTSPTPTDFRAFYLAEEGRGEGSDVWFMNPQINKDEDEYRNYRCTQGLGFMTIQAQRNGIASSFRSFVPVDDPCEVWTVQLHNTSRKERSLRLFCQLNWGLAPHPSYYTDVRATSMGRYLKEENAIIALVLSKPNALPRTGFMLSDARFQGYDLSAEEFIGAGYFSDLPQAVQEGRCRNSLGCQPRLGLIGALQYNITLKPDRKKTINILVGRTEQDEKLCQKHIRRLRSRFFSNDGVVRQFQKLQASWRDMLSRASVECPDHEINRFYNVWGKYQQKNTAQFTRALDQVGYRDVLQDLMGICDFNPSFVANMLPLILNYQLKDGRAIRQFFKYPETGAPNDERLYTDSPLWIADTLVTYLEETGDFKILDKQVGFYDLDTHRQDNRVKKTIYQHALMGIEQVYGARGQKGLCLIGYGDWTDALNGLARKGKGVSVLLTLLLVHACRRMGKLAQFLGDKSTVQRMDKISAHMTGVLNKSAWDGRHYVIGYDDEGRVVGADSCSEGKMHMSVNALALLTNAAAKARRESALLTEIQRLYTPLGYLSIDTPYSPKSFDLVGRIALQTPGFFENGAVYTHGHAFLSCALAQMGMAQEAYDSLKLFMPSNQIPDISTKPPHQMANFVTGNTSPDYGVSPYSNFTGSTAWMLKTLNHIFGVHADFDGLVIAPCVPPDWTTYRLRKKYQGIQFNFAFKNNSRRSQVEKVLINGTEIEFTSPCKLHVRDFRKRRNVNVEVIM